MCPPKNWDGFTARHHLYVFTTCHHILHRHASISQPNQFINPFFSSATSSFSQQPTHEDPYRGNIGCLDASTAVPPRHDITPSHVFASTNQNAPQPYHHFCIAYMCMYDSFSSLLTLFRYSTVLPKCLTTEEKHIKSVSGKDEGFLARMKKGRLAIQRIKAETSTSLGG
jgi:hypothetical protein